MLRAHVEALLDAPPQADAAGERDGAERQRLFSAAEAGGDQRTLCATSSPALAAV